MSPKGAGRRGGGRRGVARLALAGLDGKGQSYRFDLPSRLRSPISLGLAVPPVLPPPVVVRWSGSPVKLDLPALPAADSKVDYKNGQTLITPEHSVHPALFPRASLTSSSSSNPFFSLCLCLSLSCSSCRRFFTLSLLR